MTDSVFAQRQACVVGNLEDVARMQQSHIIGHNANQIKQKMRPIIQKIKKSKRCCLILLIHHTTRQEKKILIKIYVITSTAKVSIPVIYTNIKKLPMSPEH
ncbi:hypothetical protein ACJW31_01G117700 [Castanea mollissima]